MKQIERTLLIAVGMLASYVIGASPVMQTWLHETDEAVCTTDSDCEGIDQEREDMCDSVVEEKEGTR